MSTLFKKADRRKKRLRLAIDGPAGSGKTLTALRCAMVLARHEAAKAGRPGVTRVAVIDTENGSASIYQGDVYDGFPIEFDVIELSEFSPTRYSEITREAGRLGYDVLVIDSLSHAWSGKGGSLELVDRAADKNKGNTFTGWRDITPLQNEMIETIVRSSCHVLSTMRTKTEWVLEPNEKGKMTPRKVGMAPVQRQGVEYEFDIVLDIDEDHIARVTKSRCSAVADKASSKPGAEFMGAIIDWLDKGSEGPQDEPGEDRLVAASDVPLASGNSAREGVDPPAATISIEDQAARMAAKRAAMQQGQQQAAPAPSPSPNVPTVVVVTPAAAPAITLTPDMLEIQSLFNSQGVPEANQIQAIRKRGAESLDKLSPDGAANLLAGLRALVNGKAPPVPTTPLPVETPPAATKSTVPMITGKQIDRINLLFKELQVPGEARVAAYQKRGVAALPDLTAKQADELIGNLVAKLPKSEQVAEELHQQFLAGGNVDEGKDDEVPFDVPAATEAELAGVAGS